MSFDLASIYKHLGKTKAEEWSEIMKELKGESRTETLANVEKFILDNFSFDIAESAEGYAYFGNIDSSFAGWKLVKFVGLPI